MKYLRPSKLLITILLVFTFLSEATAEEKVLFIGNSFTLGSGGNQSVATIFDALAIAAGHEDPTTVIRAEGGKNFQYHYENSLAEIQSMPWTRVILQNYSTQPTHVGNINDHLNYGRLLYDAILSNNASTQVHLYQTWARAEAHAMISGTSDAHHFASTDEMLGELITHYQALADSLNATHHENTPVIVNPVGEAWNHAGGNLPASDPDYIDLWSSDNYHGNDYGYYLSACVHYAAIYRASPEGLYETAETDALSLNIPDEDAAFLEKIAWKTVLDKGIIDQKIRIDFGADATATANSGIFWNNLSASQGALNHSVLNGLVDMDGNNSAINLHMLSRFNSALSSGSSSSSVYVADASSDALYGNTGLQNGLSDISPQFKLSGLDPATAYSLSFYASVAETGENLQTRYNVIGDRTLSVDLHPAGNVNTLATTSPLYPDANGEISISLSPGPDNNSTHSLTSLGVMELTAHAEAGRAWTQQPMSQSIPVNQPVTFSAEVNSDRFITYQWYQDGTLIPGATDASYTLNAAPASAQGASFTLKANNGFFEIESSAALLTLLADNTEPELLMLSRPDEQSLSLHFSEPMSSTEASIPTNYQVVNRGKLINILEATLSADGTTVELSLETPTLGNVFVSSSATLSDLSGNPLSRDTTFSVLTDSAHQTLLLDFGTTYTASTSTTTWNSFALFSSIRTTVGNGTGTAYEYSASLLNTEGEGSGITFSMTDTMSGVNSSGSSSGPYDTGATRDSFFGHRDAWSGFTDNNQGVFVLSNLDSEKVYDFTFYASRTGATDNRETHYELEGSTTVSTDLNAAENISTTASIINMSPNATGEIILTISAGSQNTNNDGFYYLGVVAIEIKEASPQLFPPVLLHSGVVVDWTGEGTLYSTQELSLPWTPIDPTPSPPYLAPIPSSTPVFYRLEF
ncbi:hypothetical protein P3T73_11860 [Kiritimatiellota bacterium B12222]|nr:hypothetical protein P3T73_11860 [Kiritimatiellota bacterium B12222]